MTRSQNLNPKKNTILFKILLALSIIFCCISIFLLVGDTVVEVGKKQYEEQLDEVQSSGKILEQKLAELNQKQEKYHQEVELLKQKIAQYQPVVIPESMK